MAGLPDSFRQRGKESNDASRAMLEAGDFEQSAHKQAMAIIGQVNAALFFALADMMDYLRTTTGTDSALERRRAILQRNDAIRKAAATGNWDEFDRLTAGDDPASTGGGNATTTAG